MGEMSEAILEGIFCQMCGCLMEDMLNDNDELVEPPGYPRTCEDCEKEAE